MCNSSANINLVEQILEQGQKLRKAMVRSILKNDPFSTHVLHSKYVYSNDEQPRKQLDLYKSTPAKTPLSCEDKQKFVAYLRGDHMSKLEERRVLQMFEVMTNTEIYELTERSYSSDNSCCDCDTCKNYYKHSLSCDFNHSSTILCKERREVPPLKLYNADKSVRGFNHLKSELENLKHIDSLKVLVHSVTLNQEGNKKVYGSALDEKIKLPLSINHTYFIEYHIPELLLKQSLKSKSKVDSGLNSDSTVRLCSKKLHGEAVYFKQVSLHDIYVSDETDVSNINMKFQVSCRTMKQKNINVIGQATFNFGTFLHSKYYTCNEDLTLILSNDVPIPLGSLKVSLQLGCGQLYFGKELIDALNSNKENIVTEEHIQNNGDHHENIQNSKKRHAEPLAYLDPTRNEEDLKGAVYDFTVRSGRGKQQPLHIKIRKDETPKAQTGENNSAVKESLKEIGIPKKDKADEKEVLFSFICVSEAQFFKEIGRTYVTCRPFSRKDVLYSRLINCDSDPIYNFHTIIPLVYDDELLNELRDNYMIFEFWEKLDNQDVLLGICKIPLHQLYVAYRNPVIVKYLARNKLPIIICDWWEPVCDPLNGEVHGQSQLLVAVGTNVQIHNLETERGFKNESVKAVLYSQDEVKQNLKHSVSRRGGVLHKKSAKNTEADRKEATRSKDIGIQSNLEMDKLTEKQEQQGHSAQTDLLTAVLTQLVQQKQKVTYAESATNTENANTSGPPDISQVTTDPVTNTNLRKTADLLDSLQSALSVDIEKTDNLVPKDKFKAHVIIETALHLPSRKKCKSKKSRGRSFKQEEILPSTYVTFETLPGKKMETTNIVQQSKNPEWDYGCDVVLPADLLTNNQKRLIFKVWRKSNGSSLQPNLQNDTILGFAALDLTVLMAGLPIVSGWFNIIDFSSKCNGQIKISVSPLENLSRFRTYKIPDPTQYDNSGTSFYYGPPQQAEVDKAEEPGELLNRALKRKFTELDEITQRLRLRLSHVTNDESDTSNDDFVEEFEKDINTLCIEDDYDMINFEDITKETTQGASSALLQIQDNFIYKDTNNLLLDADFSSNCPATTCAMDVINNVTQTDSISCATSNLTDVESNDNLQMSSKIITVNPLDKQLMEGRQKIDTLLEKLSLLTHNDADTFSSRYVSGCSVKNDTNKIVENEVLKVLECKSNNIGPSSIENPLHLNLESSSGSGSLSQLFDECRPTPDGSGNI